MTNSKKKIDRNRLFVLFLIGITAIIIVAFFVLSTKRMENVYSKQMYENALDTRKEYLKDTVNNVIIDIDNVRSEYKEMYLVRTEEVRSLLQTYLDTHDTTAGELLSYLESTGVDEFSYVITDTETGEEYKTLNIESKNLSDYLITQSEAKKGSLSIQFGVSKEYADAVIKNAFSLKIKSYNFSDGAYIFVDEIQGDGDETVFKRVIHPGYPESEGQVFDLSTKDEDNNKYYLLINDSLKENGDAFVSYFYREYQSDIISKKITYVKYYPEYSWAIGMGVPSHKIVSFVQDAHEENKPLILKYTILVSVLFAIVFILCMVFILKNDRRDFKKRVRALRHDVEVDELTGASTRKYGARLLEEAYNDFRDGNESTVLMLLDVDKFKSVNDTYGHEAGDEVLKKVVRVMKDNIRKNDYLIRWGGDEFVGIFPSLTRSELEAVAKKLLFAVSDLRIKSGDETVKVTVSLGFTYFHDEDQGYQDALNRADEGLYESKTGGRNQFSITI